MSYFRTALLLAGLTALFMGVGFLIGGKSGAMIALVVAAAMNLFTYWNSDRMVLSMYGAHEVDRSTAPDLVGLVAELAGRAGLPMPPNQPVARHIPVETKSNTEIGKLRSISAICGR